MKKGRLPPPPDRCVRRSVISLVFYILHTKKCQDCCGLGSPGQWPCLFYTFFISTNQAILPREREKWWSVVGGLNCLVELVTPMYVNYVLLPIYKNNVNSPKNILNLKMFP